MSGPGQRRTGRISRIKKKSVMMRLLKDSRGAQRIWRIAACVVLFAAGCGPAADRPERLPAEGGLVFVTTLGSAPYAYLDETTKEYAGIDVDIARATAEKLGIPLKIVPMEFADLLPSVKSGKADFAANAITITPARARDVAFSRHYASDGSAFLYRVGSVVPTVPRAGRLRIGCQNASTCQFYLCYHDIDPYCFNEYDDAVEEFRKGNLDAVFHDAEAVRETVRASEGIYAITPLETRENYGVAVRKDYPALLEAVNQVVAERRAR